MFEKQYDFAYTKVPASVTDREKPQARKETTALYGIVVRQHDVEVTSVPLPTNSQIHLPLSILSIAPSLASTDAALPSRPAITSRTPAATRQAPQQLINHHSRVVHTVVIVISILAGAAILAVVYRCCRGSSQERLAGRSQEDLKVGQRCSTPFCKTDVSVREVQIDGKRDNAVGIGAHESDTQNIFATELASPAIERVGVVAGVIAEKEIARAGCEGQRDRTQGMQIDDQARRTAISLRCRPQNLPTSEW